MGPVDWLASTEDTAHQQAAVPLDAKWTLAEEAEVDGEAGDGEPIQAVEDALRDFPADEILIAGEAADTELERVLPPMVLRARAAGSTSSPRLN